MLQQNEQLQLGVTVWQYISIRNKNLNYAKEDILNIFECPRWTIHFFQKKKETNPLKRRRMVVLNKLRRIVFLIIQFYNRLSSFIPPQYSEDYGCEQECRKAKQCNNQI